VEPQRSAEYCPGEKLKKLQNTKDETSKRCRISPQDRNLKEVHNISLVVEPKRGAQYIPMSGTSEMCTVLTPTEESQKGAEYLPRRGTSERCRISL
jgi:hypothetical protein